ncbi:hypothetical protein ABK040_004455 [Willaertia magna]
MFTNNNTDSPTVSVPKTSPRSVDNNANTKHVIESRKQKFESSMKRRKSSVNENHDSERDASQYHKQGLSLNFYDNNQQSDNTEEVKDLTKERSLSVPPKLCFREKNNDSQTK